MKIDRMKCCGCGACVSKCPVNAISLKKDDEGFVYPVTDSSACIGCGQCEDACPVYDGGQVLSAMAFRHSSEKVVKCSASGGAFSAVAERFWDEYPDGIVFGAAFTADENPGGCGMKVRHIAVTKSEGLSEICGSKYLQSDLADSYSKLAHYLESGRAVLFSGTPCQVAAVLNMYGTYDKLITVDLVCNGVGSPAAFDKYLAELQARFGKVPVKVNFRNKKYEKGRGIAVIFDDESVYESSNLHDRFEKMYFVNLITRPSCYYCKYTTPNRKSDLTLGDFHGLDEIAPDFGEESASLVIAHTDKGIRYADYLKEIGETINVDISQCLQPRLREPATEPVLRKILLKSYLNMDFETFEKRFGAILK